MRLPKKRWLLELVILAAFVVATMLYAVIGAELLELAWAPMFVTLIVYIPFLRLVVWALDRLDAHWSKNHE